MASDTGEGDAMMQCSHMSNDEARALKDLLDRLKTDRGRIFWSTTQKRNNDHFCTVIDPTSEEIEQIAVLIKRGYQSADAQDAARYRYLRAHALCRNLHMDGTAQWYIPSVTLLGVRGVTLDAAIDQAMQQAQERMP
jgi:hypothetical protein